MKVLNRHIDAFLLQNLALVFHPPHDIFVFENVFFCVVICLQSRKCFSADTFSSFSSDFVTDRACDPR